MNRRMMMIVVLLAAQVAYGATESAMRRGFAADGLYDVGELDSVDLYNGNLTVQIPLGQTYRSSGTLSYQFKLAYNSNVWNFLEQNGVNLVAHWYVEDFRDLGRLVPQNSLGAEALPASQFNAGLGWQVSFGKIIGGILPNDTRALAIRYIDENGGEHAFFTELHGTTPSENLAGNGPFYTRDGTYLRMRRLDGADIEIDLPDGVTKHFTCSNCSAGSGLAAEWNLTWMADRFGNKLTINRNVAVRPPAGSTWIWTFVETTRDANGNDVVVRQHEARFLVKRTYRPAGYAADITQELLLQSLKLAACCGTGAAGTPAEYKFTYLEDARIHRPRQSNWNGSSVVIPFDPADGTVAMALLRDIEIPAGGGRWKFQYFEDGNGGPAPPDLDLQAEPYPVSDFSGRVERVVYPTGGGMRYEYERRGFLRVDCDPTKAMDRAERFLAVARRQPINSAGAANGRPWIYAGAAFHMPQNRDCKTDAFCTGTGNCTFLPKEFTSIVVDPLLKATVTFYSTFLNNGSNGSKWTIREYGLPISHAEEDAQQRPISNEVYDCSAADLTAPDAFRKLVARNRRVGETATCGEPLRKTYVQFESSGTSCDPTALGSCTHVNRRIASQRMTFYDVCTVSGRTSQYCRPAAGVDGQGDRRSMTVVNSGFDGLGNFRVSTTTADFAAAAARPAADDTREDVTWFNPAGQPAADKPWILTTYSFTRTTQHGRSEYRQYQWDDAGFLTARRSVANTRPPTSTDPDGETQGNDVLSTWGRSVVHDPVAGHVVLIDEKSYGGDLQNNLGGGFAPPGRPEYWIQRRYRAGSLVRAEYLECSGSTATKQAFLVEDNTVHDPSGLVRSSKDAWNASTTYGYDVLARFTSVTPPGEVGTTYAYPNLTLNPGSRIVGASRTSAQSGKVEEDYEYDPLGRLTVSRSTVDGAWGRKETVWGDHHRVASTSNVGETSAGLHRTTLTYDVFGRVLQSVPAGENDKRITTAYYGEHREERSIHGVANGLSSTRTVVETKNRDVFGQTLAAEEGIAGQGASYTYDMAGRLTSVVAGSQTRSFQFDGRGFLTSETHPELAGYRIEHARLDSRGNPHDRNYRTGTSTAVTPFDLATEYDAAERTKTVTQKSTGRVLKSFTYDRGKLNTATRSTWTPDPLSTTREREYQTVQSFQYHPDGRLRVKKTSVGGLTGEVRFAYDDLGSVVLTEYLPFQPPCEPNRPCPAVGTHRKVTSDYDFGTLNRICDGSTSPGVNCTTARPFVTSIGYHVNGLPTSVHRGNGVRETQDADRDFGRPSRMMAVTGALRIIWSTSTIQYDGRTNVKAIGTDRFAYDDAGRLLEASVGNAPAPSIGENIRQTFAYDRWGNMTDMTTASPGAPLSSVTFTSGAAAANRINAPAFAATYDLAGNLTAWTDPRRPGYRMHVDFDPANAAKHAWLEGPGQSREFGRVFVYDAHDERVGIIEYGLKGADAPRLRETWSIRGGANEVLRDFVREERFDATAGKWVANWSWGRDYVYRGGALTAELSPGSPEVVRHMHLDHLGSVRAVTDGNGNVLESRKYLPFGEQIASAGAASRMQFAGHERDDDGSAGPYGDVDYMHARYYSGVTGRFLSIDPVPGRVGSAQSWNRYAYVMNNPVSRVDPTGMADESPYSRVGNFVGAAWNGMKAAANDPVGFVDYLAYQTAKPFLWFQIGVLNNDPKYLGMAAGSIALQAVVPVVFHETITVLAPAAVESAPTISRAFWSTERGQVAAMDTGLALENTQAGRMVTAAWKNPAVDKTVRNHMAMENSLWWADTATGDVAVFHGAEGVRMGNFWSSIEYPALMNNPNVTSITYYVCYRMTTNVPVK